MIVILCAVFATLLLLKLASIYIDYLRHRAFATSIGNIEDDEKATGILDNLRLAYKSEDTEGPVKFRGEMRDRHGGKQYIWKLMPNVFYWVIHDSKTAQFVMNLDADQVEKAGMSKDIFRGDYNGFNNGLLLTEGSTWKAHRKIVGKYLSNHSIEAYIEQIDQSAVTFIELLCASDKPRDTEAVRSLCNNALYEVIFKCLMGDVNCNSQIDNTNGDFVRAFETISKTVLYRVDNRFKTMLFGRIPILNTLASLIVPELKKEREAMKIRDGYMEQIIKSAVERRNDGSRDLASVFVNTKDENGVNVFSDNEIKCQLFTFAFGGHETAASALIWILFYLGAHPDWSDKVKNEFESLGGAINRHTLNKLPMTTAFIKETLRLCHTLDLYIPRRATRDIELPNGAILPRGFTFTVDIANMATDPSVWGADAHKFNPARFLSSSDQIHQYQYLPFGGGRRNCVGKSFAMQQLKIFTLRAASNIKIKNDVVETSVSYPQQPPNQWTGMTWKIKSDALKQTFTKR